MGLGHKGLLNGNRTRTVPPRGDQCPPRSMAGCDQCGDTPVTLDLDLAERKSGGWHRLVPRFWSLHQAATRQLMASTS